MKQFTALVLCLALSAMQLSAQDSIAEKPAVQKERETLLYGLDSEIITLLENLKKEEQISYKQEVLTLFESAKTAALKESVISYFAAFKDDSLAAQALEAAQDPYDLPSSTVALWFRYIGAVKLTEAAGSLKELLGDDTIDYFDPIVSALAEIGGVEDADFLLDYMENNDVSVSRRQTILKALAKLNDPQIAGRLMAIADNTDENSFVRMYAAEAVGASGVAEYVPQLTALYDSTDPAFRASIVKALSGFQNNEDAESLVIQAIRDSYYRVRIEALIASKNMNLKKAEPYVLSRAENDPEPAVRHEAFTTLAAFSTKAGNDFLISVVEDKKSAETTRVKAAAALLEHGNAGHNEIIALARETLKDDKQKNLRYALGKEFAKYDNASFAGICGEYLSHSDVSTKGTGLDMFAKGRYLLLTDSVKTIADDPKGGALAAKAQRILSQR
jgi:HEAT repeat protein